VGTRWSYEPKVFDPQSPSIAADFSATSLPSWLQWHSRDGDGKSPACLHGTPPSVATSTSVTIIANWEQHGRPSQLELTFDLRIVGAASNPRMATILPSTSKSSSHDDALAPTPSQSGSPMILFPPPLSSPRISQQQPLAQRPDSPFSVHQSIAQMDGAPPEVQDDDTLPHLSPGSAGQGPPQYWPVQPGDLFPTPMPLAQRRHETNPPSHPSTDFTRSGQMPVSYQPHQARTRLNLEAFSAQDQHVLLELGALQSAELAALAHVTPPSPREGD
jgi:hypothetical protein